MEHYKILELKIGIMISEIQVERNLIQIHALQKRYKVYLYQVRLQSQLRTAFCTAIYRRKGPREKGLFKITISLDG